MASTDERLASVEAWRKQHEREHEYLESRVKTELRHEMTQISEGLKAHVSTAMKPVSKLADDVAKILALNTDQTAMLEDATRERIRRKLREEETADTKADAEVNLMRADAKAKRWQAVALVLGPIVALLAALIAAAAASHH